MVGDELKPAAQFGLSTPLSAALAAGLAIAPEARPQTVQAFQVLLCTAAPTPLASSNLPTSPNTTLLLFPSMLILL